MSTKPPMAVRMPRKTAQKHFIPVGQRTAEPGAAATATRANAVDRGRILRSMRGRSPPSKRTGDGAR